MKIFFASIQPIRMPVIYANEYHLISNEKIWKATNFQYFWKVVVCLVCLLFLVLPAAPVQARTLKINEFHCVLRCETRVRLFARTWNKSNPAESRHEKTCENQVKKREAASEVSIHKTSKTSRKSDENHGKAAPGATSGGNLAPRACWAALGVDFGAMLAPLLSPGPLKTYQNLSKT